MMSTLGEYLGRKRVAWPDRGRRIAAGALRPTPLKARVTAEGRRGARRLRVGDFQVITDSPHDFAGYHLAPGSPEAQLGVQGYARNHSYLIQAAALEVPIGSIDDEVEGFIDPRAGGPGFKSTPFYPQNPNYAAESASPAGSSRIDASRARSERRAASSIF